MLVTNISVSSQSDFASLVTKIFHLIIGEDSCSSEGSFIREVKKNIPKKWRDFERTTSHLVECGIYDYFSTMSEFLAQIRTKKVNSPEYVAFHAHSLHTRKLFFYNFFLCMATAFQIFLMELLWFHVKSIIVLFIKYYYYHYSLLSTDKQ